MHVLRVDHISYKYPNAKTKALDDVSFEIPKGSYTVIIGHNGSGKSTLARAIAGLIKPDEGSVHIQEGIQTGLVFQNPKNQIISGIVHRDTAIGPQNSGLSNAETELRVIESLNTVDMLDRANSSTMALSLGQTQKVALAGIIALRPDLLLLDEAMAMLDPESRKDIYTFLDYWHSLGNTIIHITHDEDAIEKAQNVIHMEKGKLTYYGIRERFAFPKTEPLSVNRKPGDFYSGTPSALTFEKVSFDYTNGKGISDISFSLPKGKLCAITGPSGTGKSTILELASGLLEAKEGKIFADGKIALCQQNAQGALFEPFAADDVAFGARNQGLKGKKLLALVKESMNKAAIPYEDFGERHSFELSGGEQRKLAIAGILALNTDILLFDEPTAGLDEPSRLEVLKMMKNLTDEGKTILFSTHKKDEADYAEYEIKMENGKILSPVTYDPASEAAESQTEIKPLPACSTLKGLRTVSSGMNQKSSKKSVISKILPVFKLIIFLGLFIGVLCSRNLILCGSFLVVSFIYCMLAKFPVKKLIIAFLKITPFLLIFTLFQMIFSKPQPDETILFAWKFFTVSPSKLWFCLNSYLRTLASLTVISGFYYSTPEYDLIDGLGLLLKPLSYIKIPVKYLILIIEIMFRFIPLLIDEASSIIKTQSIRGGLGKAKGRLGAIRAMIPLIVPLVAQTIKRAEALADALTVRNFH